MKYPEYAGMSYQQASREAERLIASRGGWYLNFDRLTELRGVMGHHLDFMAERGRFDFDSAGYLVG